MKKTTLGIIIWSLLMIWSLVSCTKDIAEDFNKQFNNTNKITFIKKSATKKDITFRYKLPSESLLHGKNYYYTFEYKRGKFGADYIEHPVKKVKNGYEVIDSLEKGIIIPKEGRDDYTNVFLIDDFQGEITLNIPAEKQISFFLTPKETNKDTQYWTTSAKIRKQKN